MSRRAVTASLIGAWSIASSGGAWDGREGRAPAAAASVHAYGSVPLHFEPNWGQTDPAVRFVTHGSGYSLSLTPTESVLVLGPYRALLAVPAEKGNRPGREPSATDVPGAVLRLLLLGANPSPRIEGRDLLPGRSHYLIGNDRRKWRTQVPQYARVAYEDVYPGVDLVYYGNQSQVEHDFIVAPGTDPRIIRLGVTGATGVALDDEGNLVIELGKRKVIQRAPILYQDFGGARVTVSGSYEIASNTEVRFKVGPYDSGRPLVVDPVLVFSTLLGGSDKDSANGIAVDSQGAAYVVGTTYSPNFPLVSPLQPIPTLQPNVFVTKLDPSGGAFVYSTLLGGSDGSNGSAIAIDGAGNAYVTGDTYAKDFPTQGPIYGPPPANQLSNESFITKLDPTGAGLAYSTYIGGPGDAATGIAVDSSGSAYVTGTANSMSYPVMNAFQSTFGSFPDPQYGHLDGFLSKVNPSGSALVYSTLYGGSDEDRPHGVAVDSPGNAYIAGMSGSADMPTQGALQARLAGTVLYKSTNGGSTWTATATGLDARRVYSVCVDPSDANIVLAGTSKGLYRSTDGGASWSRHATLSFGAVVDVLATMGSPPTFYAGTSGGMVWRSLDAGISWAAVLNGVVPLSGNYVTKIADAPLQPETLYAASSGGNGIYRSTNGGDTWTQVGTFPGSGRQVSFISSTVAVDPINPSIVYGAVGHGLVYKSTNGGSTWSNVSSGFPTTFPTYVVSLVTHPTVPGMVFAGLEAGSVYRSADGGASWTALNEPPGNHPLASTYSFAFAPSGVALYAAAQSSSGGIGVFKSTNDGTTWSLVLDATSLGASVRSVAVDPSHPATVFAGLELAPDAFVAKFDPDGGLVYATYLGGSGRDSANGVAVDGDGAAYITGDTGSKDFPVVGAFQATPHGFADAFVSKLDPTGAALAYSTYLGGSKGDVAYGIAVDATGGAHVTGWTESLDFPRVNAVQPGPIPNTNHAFVSLLDPTGSSSAFSTTLGGSVVDNQGRVSSGAAIAVDSSGKTYVAGQTSSPDFPIACAPAPLNPLGGTYDAFVLKLGDQTTSADLSVTVDDGRTVFARGETATYTIVVTNAGPDNVPLATLTNISPAALSGATWTCVATGGATCSAQGTGDVRDNVALPVGGTVTYELTVNVAFTAPPEDIVQTASVQGCSLGDPVPSNNTAADRDYPGPTVFSIADASSTEGNSGVRAVTAIVSVGGPIYSPTTLDFATADGSATAAADYVATSGTLTFAPGASSGQITVPIKGDVLGEGDETLFLRISNAQDGQTLRSQATITILDDDPAGTFEFSSGAYAVLESAGKAMVTVRRTGSNVGGASVHYSTSDGSATAGSDYTSVSGTLTFGPNVTVQAFSVTLTNDARVEGSETVLVTLSNPGGFAAELGPQSTAVLTIRDADVAGQVQFGAVRYTVGESSPSAMITVVRSGGAAIATVDYATVGESALESSDYEPVSGTLAFGAGERVKTFSVPVLDDGIVEGIESLSLVLSNPTGGLSLGPRATATLEIHDDELGVAFGAATYTAKESAPAMTITVNRFGDLTDTAAVSYTTSDGTATAGVDYAPAAGTLTFAPGVASRKFTVALKPDALVEGPETVQLALSTPVGTSLASPSTAMLTILDDDLAGTVQFATSSYSVAESGGRALIGVRRVGGLAGGVTVDYATASGTAQAPSDYTDASGQLTFGPGVTLQTFSVPITNDGLAEGAETVSLSLTNPTGGAVLGSPSLAVLTIVDDEPTLAFSATSYTTSEALALATITVKRLRGVSTPVSVSYATGGGTATAGTDYTASAGTLSFPAGVVSRTFTVPIVDDGDIEGDETVSLTLSNPSPGATVVPPAVASMVIHDNEPSLALVSANYSVGEAKPSVTITVRRSGSTAPPVDVHYATVEGTATAGSDYTSVSGTLGFPAGVSTRTIMVPIVSDTRDEPNETFEVTLSAPNGASLGTPSTAVVTIRDDDLGGALQFGAESYSVSESAGRAFIRVTRTGGVASEATVDYAVVGGTAQVGVDVGLSFLPVTFAAGEASKTFEVTIDDDATAEGNEFLTLVLANPGGGASLGPRTTTVLWIVDND